MQTTKQALQHCIDGFENKDVRCAGCKYEHSDPVCFHWILSDALKLIEDLEERVAIASKDVIHCNNCKHYEAFTQSCNIGDGIMLPDFYCANAESKEGWQE